MISSAKALALGFGWGKLGHLGGKTFSIAIFPVWFSRAPIIIISIKTRKKKQK
jgi:hypothetical protein